VVDAHGIPLAVLVSAANVHDSKMMLATVDAIEPIRAKTRGRLAFLQLGCALISLRSSANHVQLARTVGLDRAHGLCDTRDMTIKRLDHVSVVVDDLAAAIAFFTALGMTLEGEAPVEGPWVDRVNGLESVQVDIVMMRTPDGHGRLELTKFRNPKLVEIEPAIAPPNTLGLRSVMFTVESVDDTVARLRANGAELVGEVAQYEDKYRLCYMRGPAGIIVALAEELF
jgi:catechol 2,3-dioxygenase-like lactoylglutathione lyase family enzyme